VFLFKIIGEDTKFQRQTLPFVAQPLEAAFTGSGSLYVLTDSATNPIEYFGKDESFLYTLGESAIVGNLLANGSHLKIVQGSRICFPQVSFLLNNCIISRVRPDV